MTSVYKQWQASVEQYSNCEFLHIPASAAKAYHPEAITLSYGEMDAKIVPWQQAYAEAGYGVGHRVALLLENRPDFFIHWFALNALGVSVVPINGDMQDAEIAYLLDNSESCLAVALPERIEQIKTAAALNAHSLAIANAHDVVSLPAAPERAREQDGDEQSECALLYTSGSTGKPKGCILSNEYFLEFGRWYQTVGGHIQLEPGKERLLTPLPLVHMNAMAVSTMGMVMSGGCLIQLDRFHPRSWWQSVAESRASVVHYLGVLPAILLNIEPGEWESQITVKFGFGAGVNPAHHKTFEDRFGFPLIESWAMSESGSGGCITAAEEPRHVGTCCFGKLPDDVEVKLIDEEGQEVAFGEPGELLVRAKGDNPRKGFFSGYYKNPEATAEAWEGGYLHTGDVVRQSEDGSFHFVDRRKNVIRRSGENISALEVEAALSQDPGIDQLAVCAVPDEIRGDEVMALIILENDVENSESTAEQIVERARERLVYYKLPGYIAFVDELPTTASNKPQRGEIKKLGARILEEKRCFNLCHLKKGSKR
ncbi:AMP-binding protein [Pseudoteredinibacter isoporae]|uniref:Acyl-CoA synthetase (AMP-forming)/AMP-acid ligase II n=1 Tax=Pseudoteredinibacter isoporae TaxID=570281 RepID=A0A7X0MYH7_9GAMM|nr:AMP-binding protein [Pseudoteredinibacter isoporae]MBB6522032.1 acyl-CoA synthetase (AMP-forming)/AMP-acid ligase II [Pseudoteredinibacter isoporae]NHO87568.1 ATP-dependent acyl-CoA ligase [Pseudoteredinibacter isoporae]NIB24101.1 ATP-dependent acyl-CoA ligase [Pseudoteredinibacter isoporae]